MIPELLATHQLERVILVCLSDYGVFVEIMQSLCGRLNAAGIDATIQYTYPTDPRALHIIYNGHRLMTPINVPYLVHNYEQAGSQYVKYPHYQQLIKNGLAVLDYSEFNREHLEPIFDQPITVIPHGFHSSLVRLPSRTDNQEQVDVLFYGGMNPHRRQFQQKLEILAPEIRIKFISNYSCFGDTLIKEIEEAKIILNLHYYNDPSILEQSRIIPAICNSRLVLSERSSDVAADARFDPMVVFVDFNDFIEVCRKYLNCPELRFQRVKQAFDLLKAENLPI